MFWSSVLDQGAPGPRCFGQTKTAPRYPGNAPPAPPLPEACLMSLIGKKNPTSFLDIMRTWKFWNWRRNTKVSPMGTHCTGYPLGTLRYAWAHLGHAQLIIFINRIHNPTRRWWQILRFFNLAGKQWNWPNLTLSGHPWAPLGTPWVQSAVPWVCQMCPLG